MNWTRMRQRILKNTINSVDFQNIFLVRHTNENVIENAAAQHVRTAAKYKCQGMETRNVWKHLKWGLWDCIKVHKAENITFLLLLNALFKILHKIITNFVAPYNLVHTNVLEELTIPVFGAEDHKENCPRCENFSIIFTLLNSGLQCEIWRSLLRNFSGLLLLYCCQFQVLYKCM
jgi:hypothetical protein